VDEQMNKCILGDCRDVMRQLVADGVKVQTIVTSPPYYGLRNYGVDGQLGLEETPQKYIENMVDVFSCAWDLLADDGTLWLNIGDSYSSHKDCKSVGQSLAKGTSRETAHVMDLGLSRVRDSKMLKANGFKNKELMMIPARLAIALCDAGWYLRQDIIWAKPNPMPESVTDRCTRSHENVFMFTKKDSYFYNADAIKEPATYFDKDSRPSGIVRDREYGYDSKESQLRNRQPVYKDAKAFNGKHSDKQRGHSRRHAGFNARWDQMSTQEQCSAMRNKRSVWNIATKPFIGAHFAVMPEKLVEPCILAGSKVGDIVFDPFMGSGTVGKIAQHLGRKWLGAELNPDYIKIQNKRTAQQSLEFQT
jgi:DNA modification methylase